MNGCPNVFHELHRQLVEAAEISELNELEADSIGLKDAASRAGLRKKILFDVAKLLDAAIESASSNPCETCEPDGVFATDGSGPYDCYACGKKATSAEGQP